MIKYQMLGAPGQANLVWAEVDAFADFAGVTCSAGSIGSIKGNQDLLYIFTGAAWLRIDKPNLPPGPHPEFDGIDPYTLLTVNKLMQPYLIELSEVAGNSAYFAAAAAAVPTNRLVVKKGLVVFDTTATALKVCTVAGAAEKDTYTVTAGAGSAAGNLTIELNNVSKTVAVLKGDSILEVAAKIRKLQFDGWDAAGGEGAVVVFQKQDIGTAIAPTFAAASTGAAATVARTTTGGAATWKTVTVT